MINQIEKQRDINTVTTEIKTICEQARAMALVYAIEVGRRLYEAKEMLPHGEWSIWLKEKVDFSQSTANNYMKLFDEYGDKQIGLFGAEINSQAFGNLTYTKALKLLAVPEEERETFIKENDVDNISIRKLDEIIKERDEAVKEAERIKELQTAADAANATIEEYRKNIDTMNKQEELLKAEIDKLTEKLEKSKTSEKKAKEKLKELKENPEISDEVLNKIKSEAEAQALSEQESKIESKIAKISEELEKAKKEKQAAEAAAEEAAKEAEDIKIQMKMASADVAEFKAVFEQVQECMLKITAIIERIENSGDTEIAGKLKSAVMAFLKEYEEG